MKTAPTLTPLLAGLVITTALSAPPAAAGEADWPQWRGPEATGHHPESDPPTEWSEEKNVLWKVEVPGRGHASPIVWDGRVFVLSAVPAEAKPAEPEEPAEGSRRRGIEPTTQRFEVLALSREDGSVDWRHSAIEMTPPTGTHPDGTWASASPVTDGEVLAAHFGSAGLFVYDLGGKLLWQKDLGDMQTRNSFGEGSSPAIHGDTMVVVWDHEGDSFIVALDKKTGEERWRAARDEPTSWATPIVVEAGGRPQVVVPATGASRAYDLASGEVVWQLGGMTMNVVPSPVYGNGMVYLMSGFRGNALQAVKVAGAKGDLADSEAVVWTHDRHTSYVPSPLLYGDKLYFLKSNSAILSCLDAGTGEIHYTEKRIEGLDNVYSSIVGAGGRIYVTGREGTTVVLRHGPEYEVLATNTLDDGFDASPAIAGDEIYLRGRTHLYRIGEAPSAEGAAGR